EAGQICAAVAAAWFLHDPGAGQPGELRAAVFGAVVDDDDLAVERTLAEHAIPRGHTLHDALGLVEAGDDDRHQNRVGNRDRAALGEDVDRHVPGLTLRLHPDTSRKA